MIWQAKDGQRVKDAMALSKRQREMTLRSYRERDACIDCGEADVPVYDCDDGLICALCEGKGTRQRRAS